MSSGTLLRVGGSILGAFFALFLGVGAPEGGNGALFTLSFTALERAVRSCWELDIWWRVIHRLGPR